MSIYADCAALLGNPVAHVVTHGSCHRKVRKTLNVMSRNGKGRKEEQDSALPVMR